MDKNTRALLKISSSMDMVSNDYQMVIPMRVNIMKANPMVTVCMYGKMERLTKERLFEESVKDWEL